MLRIKSFSHIKKSDENKFFNDFTTPQENDKIPHHFTKIDGNNFYSQFLNKKIDFTMIFEFYLFQGT